MNLCFSAICAAPLLLASHAALAQINVDLSQSTVSIYDAQSIKVENLNVHGLGSYQVVLKWNPVTLSFEPRLDTLTSNGAYCERAVASGVATSGLPNKDGYIIRQRTADGITVGAISVTNTTATPYIASWAKTSSADSNPYLVGRSVPNFDASKSYGVLGIAPGADGRGVIVEVEGSFASRVFIFKTVEGGHTRTFTFGAEQVQASANCASTRGGGFASDVRWSQGLGAAYQFAKLGTNAGTIAVENPAAARFVASWSVAGLGGVGVAYGTVESVNTVAFVGFNSGYKMFVTDIGDGIAITSLSTTDRAISTAVFRR